MQRRVMIELLIERHCRLSAYRHFNELSYHTIIELMPRCGGRMRQKVLKLPINLLHEYKEH